MGSGRGYLIVWVLGALFAAMAAGFGSRGLQAGSEVDSRAAEKAGTLTVSDQDIGENEGAIPEENAVVLLRGDDGHFYADTEVNGQSIRMLVDTGATAIALSREDARRAGVGTSIGMQEVVGQGASGDVHGEVVTLDRVALGDIEAEAITAVVLDDGQMSLLGQTFLREFDSVEIRGDKMVLR